MPVLFEHTHPALRGHACYTTSVSLFMRNAPGRLRLYSPKVPFHATKPVIDDTSTDSRTALFLCVATLQPRALPSQHACTCLSQVRTRARTRLEPAYTRRDVFAPPPNPEMQTTPAHLVAHTRDTAHSIALRDRNEQLLASCGTARATSCHLRFTADPRTICQIARS